MIRHSLHLASFWKRGHRLHMLLILLLLIWARRPLYFPPSLRNVVFSAVCVIALIGPVCPRLIDWRPMAVEQLRTANIAISPLGCYH